MEGLGVLLAVVAAFVANLRALRDMTHRPRGLDQGCSALISGFVVVLLLAPKAAGQAVTRRCSFYGALTLMRVVPRGRV
jgi:hypothetical protein